MGGRTSEKWLHKSIGLAFQHVKPSLSNELSAESMSTFQNSFRIFVDYMLFGSYIQNLDKGNSSLSEFYAHDVFWAVNCNLGPASTSVTNATDTGYIFTLKMLRIQRHSTLKFKFWCQLYLYLNLSHSSSYWFCFLFLSLLFLIILIYIEKSSTIQKSNLSFNMKRDFFQATVTSAAALYESTGWTLIKPSKKKFDGYIYKDIALSLYKDIALNSNQQIKS